MIRARATPTPTCPATRSGPWHSSANARLSCPSAATAFRPNPLVAPLAPHQDAKSWNNINPEKPCSLGARTLAYNRDRGTRQGHHHHVIARHSNFWACIPRTCPARGTRAGAGKRAGKGRDDEANERKNQPPGKMIGQLCSPLEYTYDEERNGMRTDRTHTDNYTQTIARDAEPRKNLGFSQ